MTQYLFTSERLGFRNWLQKDCAPFEKINQDEEVMKYFPKTLTVNETALSIERFNEQYAKSGYTFFAVELLETEDFLGFIGLSDTTFVAFFTPCVEIGWRLKKEIWNQGLATEGAAECLRFAKEDLKIREIFSFTPQTNLSSQRVMQKIGMNHIGTFEHPNLPSGHTLSNHVLYKVVLD